MFPGTLSRVAFVLAVASVLLIGAGRKTVTAQGGERPVGTPVPNTTKSPTVRPIKWFVWKSATSAPRRAKPFATEDEFVAWFLSTNGGLQDMTTNGLPPALRERIASGMAGKSYNDWPLHGPVAPGKYRVTWSSISTADLGDHYRSMTVEPTGRRIKNVVMGETVEGVYRIVVEGSNQLWIIDTLPATGEQLVRVRLIETPPFVEPDPASSPPPTPGKHDTHSN